jgi:ribA/ribD-fused uncharacterized protein
MIVDGVTYNCCEQYMMAQKALLFGDMDKHDLIMKSNDPREQKKLGKEVSGYTDTVWHAKRMEIVFKGNYAKFSQHADLKTAILGTGNRIIVEASPVDKIWGIGLPAAAAEACFPEKWRGQNLLGETLMRVRTALNAPPEPKVAESPKIATAGKSRPCKGCPE